jgi:hypothetical protein
MERGDGDNFVGFILTTGVFAFERLLRLAALQRDSNWNHTFDLTDVLQPGVVLFSGI